MVGCEVFVFRSAGADGSREGWETRSAGSKKKIPKARTGLLLLDGQLLPVALHAVAEGHPQVSLLLERHSLPSLLDVGERRLGDGVGGLGAAGGGPGDDAAASGDALAQHARCRGSHHGGMCGKIKGVREEVAGSQLGEVGVPGSAFGGT